MYPQSQSDLVAGLLGLAGLFVSGAVCGQVLTTVEFSFSNPGARSMGFGGAFVALADDATAAFANPAGLVQLVQPEISVEIRSRSARTTYTAGGRGAGRPTGIGIDTVGGPLTAESTQDLTGVSFLSFVLPRRNWALAFFEHQLLDFELSQEIQGLLVPGSVFAGTFRGPIERGFLRQEVVTRGLAVGIRTGERLSFGLGLSYFDPTIDWLGREYLPDEDTLESYFARSSFLPQRLVHDFRGSAEKGDWGLSAGFLWFLTDRWKIGGSYRQGPGFRLEGRLEAGPAHPSLPDGAIVAAATPWTFPDVYGLGIAYRSADDRWTAAFEWDRVEYSILIESLDPRLKNPGEGIDDGDELHLGIEYAILDSAPVLALRLGLWHDPDHRVRSRRDDPFSAEFLPGEDELHLAAGVGLSFRRLQIDLGMDLSEQIDSVALSAIYSF